MLKMACCLWQCNHNCCTNRPFLFVFTPGNSMKWHTVVMPPGVVREACLPQSIHRKLSSPFKLSKQQGSNVFVLREKKSTCNSKRKTCHYLFSCLPSRKNTKAGLDQSSKYDDHTYGNTSEVCSHFLWVISFHVCSEGINLIFLHRPSGR